MYNGCISGSVGSDGKLSSGTADNLRWQIIGTDVNTGTFSLLVRQGNDLTLSPSILERWDNLSLDPTQNNYIEKRIGNSRPTIQQDGGEYYVQSVGSFTNMCNWHAGGGRENVLRPSWELEGACHQFRGNLIIC